MLNTSLIKGGIKMSRKLLLKSLENSNKILRGVRLKLFTTEEDENQLYQMCHIRELVYDWAIDKLWKNYNDYHNNSSEFEILSREDLGYMFTAYRNSNECDPLIKSLHTGIAKVTLDDASKTFQRLRNSIPRGYKPKFHGKHGRDVLSYGLRLDRSYILDGVLYTENLGSLPRLQIPVLTHDYDGCCGRSGLTKDKVKHYWYRPRIIKKYDGYYLTFCIPRDRKSLDSKPWSEPIGIDLGCKTTFQLSTEEFFNQPDVSKEKEFISKLDHDITRLYKLRKRRAQKEGVHVWEIPKSKHELTLIEKRQKTYNRIHNKIEYFYYQVINDIVKRRPEAIVLETIYVQDILRKAPYNVRKNIVQVYFCMIRCMFESKCDEYSIPLYEVNNNYPSSLLCNKCGYKHEKLGNNRVFICPNCGYTVDRDLNASRNLRDVYMNKEVDNIKWWNGHGNKLVLMDKLTHIYSIRINFDRFAIVGVLYKTGKEMIIHEQIEAHVFYRYYPIRCYVYNRLMLLMCLKIMSL